MSMQSSIGAETVATEISMLIKKKMAEQNSNPETVKTLQEVLQEVENIKQAANKGWY